MGVASWYPRRAYRPGERRFPASCASTAISKEDRLELGGGKHVLHEGMHLDAVPVQHSCLAQVKPAPQSEVELQVAYAAQPEIAHVRICSAKRQ